MNFFNEKKLIKIKASPILYLSRASLESKYKKKLSSDEYKSLDELEAELNNQTELQNFEKLIGSNESMYQIVEKIKATVAYPPVGLPMCFMDQLVLVNHLWLNLRMNIV